ncbi:HEAT repeat domain-containing protein [Candidatus Riflebacteria bacterium]
MAEPKKKLDDNNVPETLRLLDEIAESGDFNQLEKLKRFSYSSKNTFLRIRAKKTIQALKHAHDESLEKIRPDLKIALMVFRKILTPVIKDLLNLLKHPDAKVTSAVGHLLVDLEFPQVSQWLLQEFLNRNDATNLLNPLIRISVSSIVDYLLEELRNPEREGKKEIIKCLGSLPSIYSVLPLITALSHEDSDVKMMAAEALGKLGDRRAVAPLMTLFENTENRNLKFVILRSLGCFGKDHALTPLLEQYKKTENQDMKAFIVPLLARFNVPEAVDVLISILESDNPRARANAIESFKILAIPITKKIEYLLPLIEDKNPRARANCLGTLWQFYQEMEEKRKELTPEQWKQVQILKNKVVDCAYKMSKQLDKKMRLSVAYILREMNDVKFTFLLLQLLREDDEHVKKVASASLSHVRISENINLLMKTLIFEELVPVQLNILKALENLGDLQSHDVDTNLQKLFKKTEVTSVKAAIITTLGKLKNPEKRMVFFTEALKHTDPRVRANSVEIIGRLRTLESTPLLREALRDENHRVQGTAILSLFLMGELNIIETLFQFLRSNESSIVLTGIHILSEICERIKFPKDSREVLLLFEALKRHPLFESSKTEHERMASKKIIHWEIEKYRNLIQARPKDGLSRYLLTRCLVEAKMYREALIEIEKLFRLQFKKPEELYYLKGLIYLENKRVTTGLEFFKRTLKANFEGLDFKLEMIYKIATKLEEKFPSLAFYFWEYLVSMDESYHDSKSHYNSLKSKLKQQDTYKEVGPKHLAAIKIHKYYKLLKEIGHGSEAIVVKAKDIQSQEIRAVKIFYYPKDKKGFSEAMRQIHLLKDFNDLNLIKIHDVVNLDRLKYIAMDYGGNSLREILRVAKTLSIKDVQHIAGNVLSGLFFLNLKGYSHDDLKPENILVDGERRVRLCDMGMQSMLPHSLLNTTNPYICPPEKQEELNKDVYAFGVILHEMATGQVPGNLADGEYIPLHKIDTTFPPFFSEVVERCIGLGAKTFTNVKKLREYFRTYKP